MRRDLRVGLGIGGVILAVLTVYLVVQSGHSKRVAVNDTAPADTDSTTDTETTVPPEAPTVAMPPVPTAAPQSPAPPRIEDVFSNTSTPATGSPPAPATHAPTWDDVPRMNGVISEGAAVSETPVASSSGHASVESQFGSSAAPRRAVTTDPLASASGGAISGGSVSTPHRPSHVAAAGARDAATHVVAAGETFSSIARAHYGDARYYLQIIKANPSVNPNAIRPGTKLVLPELSTHSSARSTSLSGRTGSSAAVDHRTQYTVQAGDSLYRISQRLYGDGNQIDALYEANRSLIGPDRQRLKIGWVLRLPAPPTVAAAR